MIGLIQHVLLVSIKEAFGQAKLEEVLQKAGLDADASFRIDTDYSDEQYHQLVAAAKDVTQFSDEELDQFYAKSFLRITKKIFPMWFNMSKNSYELLTRQSAIHNSLATGVKGDNIQQKVNDKFKLDKYKDRVVTHYKSENKNCGLYKCLAHEVADYYQDTIKIQEHQCMKQGAPECEIEVSWISYHNG